MAGVVIACIVVWMNFWAFIAKIPISVAAKNVAISCVIFNSTIMKFRVSSAVAPKIPRSGKIFFGIFIKKEKAK